MGIIRNMSKSLLFLSKSSIMMLSEDIMSDDIERLEIKISYLEKENADLNDTLIDLEKKMTKVLSEVDELKKKVIALLEDDGAERENRRPPHY